MSSAFIKIVLGVFIVSLSRTACATISFAPKPFEDRFADSDLVCQCVLHNLRYVNRGALTNGKVSPANYEATLVVKRLYKGDLQHSDLVVRFSNWDPACGEPLLPSISYLMFLRRGSQNTYDLAEPEGSIVVFSPPPETTNQMLKGAEELQAEIVQTLMNSRNNTARRGALMLLLQFKLLMPKTIASLEETSRSQITDVAVISLEILCRASANPDSYLPQLISILQGYQTSAPPLLDMIGDTVATVSTANDLGGLEKLGDSSIPFLRQSAMLGIRRIKDPASVPFLINKLDSDDHDVQYEAVITLAEMTGRSGDYGPGLGPFDNNPYKYIQIWKTWWEREGKLQYSEPRS
jgi:hypothetical protein